MGQRTLWVAVFLIAVIWASFAISLAQIEQGPVLCLFRSFTGLPCPGCGLSRSFVATAHGEFGLAFSQHLFGPLAFGVCVATLIWIGFQKFTRETVSLPISQILLSKWLWPAWGIWGIWSLGRIVWSCGINS